MTLTAYCPPCNKGIAERDMRVQEAYCQSCYTKYDLQRAFNCVAAARCPKCGAWKVQA